jgi:hypothetical protein
MEQRDQRPLRRQREVVHHQQAPSPEHVARAARQQRQVGVLREVRRRDAVELERARKILGARKDELDVRDRVVRRLVARDPQILVTQLDADNVATRETSRDRECRDAGPAREIEHRTVAVRDAREHPLLPPAVESERRPVHHRVVRRAGAGEKALDQLDSLIVAIVGRRSLHRRLSRRIRRAGEMRGLSRRDRRARG